VGTDAVVDEARRVADLSRRTVNESLRVLVEARLVRRFHVGSGARFEAKTDDHQHMVCTSCGRIADVDGVGPPAPADSQGFVISSAEVVYEGLCPVCAGRSDDQYFSGVRRARAVTSDAVPTLPTVVQQRQPSPVSRPTAAVPPGGDVRYGENRWTQTQSQNTLAALQAALENLCDEPGAKPPPAEPRATNQAPALPRRAMPLWLT